jgi:hypothetical protein
MNKLIAIYNDNVFINVCLKVTEGFSLLSDFIGNMRETGDLQSRNKIIEIYSKIFKQSEYSSYFEFEVARVINPHYSLFSGKEYKLTEGNSSYHILLKIADSDFLKLDQIYDQKLSGLLRIYKNMFSVIDSPEHEVTHEALKKREEVIQNVLQQMQVFLDSIDRRTDIKTREKLDAEIIKNIPFNGFYHLTHISNLQSIVENGILSRNKLISDGIKLKDISNSDIQSKRMRPEAIYGRMIHDYVPLYINPKNPFLASSRVRDANNKLALIEVYPHILVQHENTLFSDGNAAEKETNFFGKKDDLEHVNWTLLQNGKWNEEDSKRIMCSEVLIPDCIHRTYIQKIYIRNTDYLEEVMRTKLNSGGIELVVSDHLFRFDDELV